MFHLSYNFVRLDGILNYSHNSRNNMFKLFDVILTYRYDSRNNYCSLVERNLAEGMRIWLVNVKGLFSYAFLSLHVIFVTGLIHNRRYFTRINSLKISNKIILNNYLLKCLNNIIISNYYYVSNDKLSK